MPSEVRNEIRGQVLVWFGIVGGALTIVNFWSNFITLADWMHWIVGHFAYIMHAVWARIGSIVSIKIPEYIEQYLSLLAFYSAIIVGTLLRSGLRKYKEDELEASALPPLLISFGIFLLTLMVLTNIYSTSDREFAGILSTTAALFAFVLLFYGNANMEARLYCLSLILILLFTTYPMSHIPYLKGGIITLTKQAQYVDMFRRGRNRHGSPFEPDLSR
jgi:hypothetical protein